MVAPSAALAAGALSPPMANPGGGIPNGAPIIGGIIRPIGGPPTIGGPPIIGGPPTIGGGAPPCAAAKPGLRDAILSTIIRRHCSTWLSVPVRVISRYGAPGADSLGMVIWQPVVSCSWRYIEPPLPMIIPTFSLGHLIEAWTSPSRVAGGASRSPPRAPFASPILSLIIASQACTCASLPVIWISRKSTPGSEALGMCTRQPVASWSVRWVAPPRPITRPTFELGHGTTRVTSGPAGASARCGSTAAATRGFGHLSA
mmetsp:Transcript_30176/g.79256  ORF Transcript_30176/g.79256 Transcript_30176/m.79256 type:complete len:258 (+) Transcript_30176:997-1770(+)